MGDVRPCAISTYDIVNAVARDQLRLLYQPQVDIATGRLAGVEALLRWDHPHLGFLAPSDFVAAIGACRLWNRLTDGVLDRGHRRCRRLARRRSHDPGVGERRRQRCVAALVPAAAGSPWSGRPPTPRRPARPRVDRVLGVLRNLKSWTPSPCSACCGYRRGDRPRRFRDRVLVADASPPAAVRAVKIDRSFVQSIDSSAPERPSRERSSTSADHSVSTASSRASNVWPSGMSSPAWERRRSRATSSPVPARPRTRPGGSDVVAGCDHRTPAQRGRRGTERSRAAGARSRRRPRD